MQPEFSKWQGAIADTSCFILLDKIEALHILPALSNGVLTTPEIATEFGKQFPAWVNIRPAVNKSLQELLEQDVDKGEASAIALAKEITGILLIIDDMRGRKLAQRMNIAVTGTLGLLLRAKQEGIITSLKPYVDKIMNTNFHVSPVLLQSMLTAANE